MSLIEKIDAEITKLGNRIEQYENGNKIAYGISVGLEKAKKIILSEQKEPDTDNNVVTFGDKIRESNESLAEYLQEKYHRVDEFQKERVIKIILSKLNQPYTE